MDNILSRVQHFHTLDIGHTCWVKLAIKTYLIKDSTALGEAKKQNKNQKKKHD